MCVLRVFLSLFEKADTQPLPHALSLPSFQNDTIHSPFTGQGRLDEFSWNRGVQRPKLQGDKGVVLPIRGAIPSHDHMQLVLGAGHSGLHIRFLIPASPAFSSSSSSSYSSSSSRSRTCILVLRSTGHGRDVKRRADFHHLVGLKTLPRRPTGPGLPHKEAVGTEVPKERWEGGWVGGWVGGWMR